MNREIGYYITQAHNYALDVINGKILACQNIKLACERYFRDLENENTKEFPYYYDQHEAERVCSFFELLPHVKGELASKSETIKLEPWQCFMLCQIYGWRKTNTKLRRFRTAFIFVPRKNGKSPIGSGIALQLLSFDNEFGAEVYTAASKKEQAEICWRDAKSMLEKDSEFCEYFDIQYNSRHIYVQNKNSYLKALSKDQKGTLDGLNIHGAVVDELHAHQNSDTWNVISTGIAARQQPLIFAITTAGFNRASICYERYLYSQNVLNGNYKDESFFCLLYGIDKEDDWRDPDVWQKANPNLGVSVNKEYIKSACEEAINSSQHLNNFLTKHLNVWCSSDVAWVDVLKFEECANTELKEEDCIKQNLDLFVAVDMASKRDFCSICKVYLKYVNDVKHYYVFTQQFLNEKAIEESNVEALKGWVVDGWIKTNKGETTDYTQIKNELLKIAKQKPKYIGFDPYQSAQLIQELRELNIKNLVEYGQQIKNMNESMKEIEGAIFDKRLQYNGDPVLAWMVSNVVAFSDSNGNIKPSRNKNAKFDKIDSAVSMIMAIGLTIKEKPKKKIYQII